MAQSEAAPTGSVAEVSSPPATQVVAAITPYMYALRCDRDEELAAEYERFVKARVNSDTELMRAKSYREPFATDLEFAANQLDKVSGELTEDELNRRGPAELDEQKWPPVMLHERRRRQRKGVQRIAEEEWRQVSSKMRVAALAVEHAQLALDTCLQESQAVGWQIVHHYGHREATYLSSLARTHRDGPALAERLRCSDRQLPDWLLRTEKEEDES